MNLVILTSDLYYFNKVNTKNWKGIYILYQIKYKLEV